MRNVRQFCNGMKNYLVKHGEGDFHLVVHQERDKVGVVGLRARNGTLTGHSGTQRGTQRRTV